MKVRSLRRFLDGRLAIATLVLLSRLPMANAASETPLYNSSLEEGIGQLTSEMNDASQLNQFASGGGGGGAGSEKGFVISFSLSGCVLSFCAGSACLGSGCGGSACILSGCGASMCAGSLCNGSSCGGSGCITSFCGGSGCTLSVCGGSGCGGSGCVVSFCAGSACGGSACLGSACGASICGGSACGLSTCYYSHCGGSVCSSSTCVWSACIFNDGCVAQAAPQHNSLEQLGDALVNSAVRTADGLAMSVLRSGSYRVAYVDAESRRHTADFELSANQVSQVKLAGADQILSIQPVTL